VTHTTREAVRRLLAEGRNANQIAAELGKSKATVAYHKRMLGLTPDSRFSLRHNWAEVQRYHDAGNSMRKCVEHFGFRRDTWYSAIRRGALVARVGPTPLAELLVKGKRRGRHNIKLRLIAAGLKDSRCERCGISEWRDEPLSMSLHHVNGDGLDNRLENLELLCPNCHSQTPNFGVGNRTFAGASTATPPPPPAADTHRS
jgi:HNH endonuclease